MTTPRSIDNRICAADPRAELVASEARAAREHHAQMGWILECESLARCADDGHRNFAQWIGAQLQISEWDARRRIDAAHALKSLPQIDAAFARGDLTLTKIVELCRFATAEKESKLLPWAIRVKPRTIKHKADVETRKHLQEVLDIDRARFLRHWWMDDGRLGLEGAFPPDQGAVIAKALDRLADRLPDIIEQDDVPSTPPDAALDVRRADALYAMASARVANDEDADRAMVVVHAPLAALVGSDARGCEIEHGPAIDASTALRMACDARLEVTLYNEIGRVVGIGRADRKPPRWLLRQLRYRDGGCTFPGCDAKRFLHAHHIVHWIRGGSTDLDNLILVCSFHHKVLHEYGWQVELGRDGLTRWFRPGGMIYEPGRAPPQTAGIERCVS